MRRSWLLVSILLICIIPVLAHVPVLPGEGRSFETAVRVPDAAKSFALYGDLAGPGEADYYRLELAAGDELRASVSTPDPAPFAPAFVLIGPGIEGSDAPAGIAVPPGMGGLVIAASRPPRADLEPFTPMALYETASYRATVNITGPVWVLVTADSGGRYVLGTGYLEEFSPIEWLTVPVDRLRIHLWQGQSPLLVLGPLAAVVVVGGLLLALRRHLGIASLLAALAGLIFLGSGLGLLVETGIALLSAEPNATAVVPVALGLIAFALGGVVVRAALRPGGFRTTDRAVLAAVAVAGLILWAGVVVGPVLALVAALFPTRTL